MAQQVALKAVSGRELGSGSARRLRASGKIPGVVYGMDSHPLPVAVDYAEARVALSGDAGMNALLKLEIDGKAELCLVKELQRHVVRDEVTHIDFLRVDPNADIEIEVPIILLGEAKAVTNVAGMVDQIMFTILVATKPTSIPNEVEYDISDMQVGDTLRVEDLPLPDGVRAISDQDEAVAIAAVTRSTLEAMRKEGGDEAVAIGGEAAEDADEDGDGDADGGDED